MFRPSALIIKASTQTLLFGVCLGVILCPAVANPSQSSTSQVLPSPLSYPLLHLLKQYRMIGGELPLSLRIPESDSEVDELFPDGEGIRGPQDEAARLLPEKPDNPALGFGVIKGEVYDKEGKGLAGVIVRVPALSLSTRTDQDGLFAFAEVSAGEQTVSFNKLGYINVDREVTIKIDTVSELSVNLEERPIETDETEYELDEMEIVGEYVEEEDSNQFDIELAKIETPKLITGIGKAEFTKQSVSNAAEALGKVSGANIVDGKFVVIRGLADRYVTTSFNNSSITSADPSRKAVQLDLFPTSILEGITVSKTYDASMIGDFGGGAVNISTLSIPEERFFDFKYKAGYNSNLDGDFYRHGKRDIGYWGDVDNPISRSIAFPNGTFLGATGPNPNPTIDAAWDEILRQSAFRGKKDKAQGEFSWTATYGDSFDLGEGNRLGVVAAFGRGQKDSVVRDRLREFPVRKRFQTQTDYTSSVDWSAFLSTNLELGDKHRLSLSYFRKHDADDKISTASDVEYDANGIRWGNFATDVTEFGIPRLGIPGFGADAYYKGEFWQTDTTVRDLNVLQMLGDHEVGDSGIKLSWGITKINSSESRPNSTTLNYGVLDFTDERLQLSPFDPEQSLFNLAAQFNSDPQFGPLGLTDPSWQEVKDAILALNLRRWNQSRLDSIEAAALTPPPSPTYNPSLGRVPTFGNEEYTGDSPGSMASEILTQLIEEDSLEFFSDIEVPLMLEEDRGIKLGAGFRWTDKIRSSRGQSYVLDFNNVDPSLLYGPGALANELAQNEDLIASIGTDGSTNLGTLGNGNDREVRNYDGNSTILGLYLKGEIVWDDLNFTYGLRRETETRGYRTSPAPLNQSSNADRNGEIEETSYIPGLSLSGTMFNDKLKIGTYYSKTLARPTFFEFLPAVTIQQDTGFQRRGQFELQDTIITNLDLSFDYTFDNGNSFVISPFYKELDKPIISVFRRSDNFVGFQNAENGSLRGFEIEYNFTSISPWSLRGNYTFIEPRLTALINTGVSGLQEVSIQYPNQPRNIFNLSFGYENEDWGLSSNLIYNYTGENVVYPKIETNDADIVAQGTHSLDFNIRKTFEFENFDCEFGFIIKNLLDSDTNLRYEGGGDTFEGRTYDQIKRGRLFMVESKISF